MKVIALNYLPMLTVFSHVSRWFQQPACTVNLIQCCDRWTLPSWACPWHWLWALDAERAEWLSIVCSCERVKFIDVLDINLLVPFGISWFISADCCFENVSYIIIYSSNLFSVVSHLVCIAWSCNLIVICALKGIRILRQKILVIVVPRW